MGRVSTLPGHFKAATSPKSEPGRIPEVILKPVGLLALPFRRHDLSCTMTACGAAQEWQVALKLFEELEAVKPSCRAV